MSPAPTSPDILIGNEWGDKMKMLVKIEMLFFLEVDMIGTSPITSIETTETILDVDLKSGWYRLRLIFHCHVIQEEVKLADSFMSRMSPFLKS